MMESFIDIALLIANKETENIGLDVLRKNRKKTTSGQELCVICDDDIIHVENTVIRTPFETFVMLPKEHWIIEYKELKYINYFEIMGNCKTNIDIDYTKTYNIICFNFICKYNIDEYVYDGRLLYIIGRIYGLKTLI